MPDFLIALGILVLLGVGVAVTVYWRKNGTEDEQRDTPADRPHPDRVAYEAEVAKAEHLPPAEEAEVAELHAFFEEIGTGEQFLVLAFDADPLSAPIPDDRTYAEPDLWNDVFADRLSLFTWTLPAEPAVSFSSVQVSEPPPPSPLALESFTTGWTRSEMDAILAKGKAGADR